MGLYKFCSKRFKSKTSNGKLIIEEKNKKWKPTQYVKTPIIEAIEAIENTIKLRATGASRPEGFYYFIFEGFSFTTPDTIATLTGISTPLFGV